MRKQTSILAAAALVVAGLTFAVQADDNATPPASNTPAANAPANNGNSPQQGQVVSDANAQEIRQRLVQATQDAFSTDPVAGIRGDLIHADADRLNQGNVKSDDLSQLTDEIKKAWHDKYNDSLQPKDAQVALSDVQIVPGNLVNGDQARLAAQNLPPEELPGQKRGNYVPDQINNPPKNYQPDQATVIISSGHDISNATGIRVAMVQEGVEPRHWRIEAPADLDAQKLHDNLLKQLTAIRDDQGNWPADENKAFCSLTRHVLQAVAGDQALNNGENAVPAGSTMEPGNPNANPNNPATQPSVGQ